MVTPDPIRPILSNVEFDHALAILGAMRSVAEAGRGSTAADAETLRSAARYMLGYQGPVHTLTGYNTTGRGEILASTFTAMMHHGGHVLPVIFSWHLATEINRVASASAGGLDPEEVWRALAAGAQCPVDSFALGWPFWSQVERHIDDVGRDWRIPPGGLDRGEG